MVNRRTLLKQLAFIAGGVLVLPACMQDKSKSGLLLKNISIDADEEALLAEIAETILPATDTPGAKDVYAHLFALTMIDDCAKKENQEQFINGLRQMEKWSRQKLDVSFTKATPAQRESLLQAMNTDASVPEDIKAFYKKLKGLTVQAYVTSKFYLTEVQPYQLTPGFFNGCVPVKQANKKAYKI